MSCSRNFKKLSLILVILWLTLAACDANNISAPTIQKSSGVTTTPGSNPSMSVPVPISQTANVSYDGFKIDTLLSDLSVKYRSSGPTIARQFAHDLGILDNSNQLHFGLTLMNSSDLPTVEAVVNKLGGQIFEQYQQQLGIAIGLDSFENLQKQSSSADLWHQLTKLPQVRDIKVLQRPTSNDPNIELLSKIRSTAPLSLAQSLHSTFAADPNQGVSKTGADLWQQAGFRGQNVKIGIIDGGFHGYQNFLNTVALPPQNQITFKSFLFGSNPEGNEEHGVAVAEVVHSLAPDAQLFLTPIEDEIGFAKAVDYLLANHVKIIQSSLGWGGLWPGDGTGLMDSKLNEARAQGVLPIVSAGNYGQSHYMNDLSPDNSGYEQFLPNNNLIKLNVEADSAWVALRWDETWNAPQTNLDLYVLDSNHQLLGTSRNVQGNGSSKPPSELVPFHATAGQTYYVQVRLIGKMAEPKLHFHLFAYNATIENSTPAQSLATPGDAKGAISVGATSLVDDKLEDYSSQGPTQDGRPKPELLAPSGVTNLVYGRYNQAFGGTSASAPQVSGVAAIVWSAAPDLKADQVERYLERNAIALNSNGEQTATNFGRIKLGSVQSAKEGEAELLGPVPTGPVTRDDFHDRFSGLPDDILAYYGKQPDNKPAYFMRVSNQGLLGWSVYQKSNYEQFKADFTVTEPAPKNEAFYGLVFWQQSQDNYHVLLVSGNRYALLQRNGSEWKQLISWTSSTALKANDQNQHIGLEATKNYIKVFSGDTVLQKVLLNDQNPVKIGGKLGFACGKFGTTNQIDATVSNNNPASLIENTDNTVISFNNLVVTPLTD